MLRTHIKPREWQSQALKVWLKSFRGIVSVVTGGGKTVFAELCISEFLARNPTSRVLIVVPTQALLDQWFVSLTEDLEVTPEEISIYSGQEKSPEVSAINIAIINTARQIVTTTFEEKDTFLILDECHRAGSPVNSQNLKGNYAATLGLSATPHREGDSGFEDFLEPTIGPIIFTYDYKDAAADGIICPFSLINVKVPMLSDELEEYKALTRRAIILKRSIESGNASQSQLKRILIKRARVSANASYRIPACIKLMNENRKQRSIIFHESVFGAQRIFEALERHGHRATIYHSQIGAKVRRDNLKLFRKGLFDVLVSCKALDEGMNVPEAQIAIIASSSASIRQRIQRLGRVLRPASNKQSAKVYTLYATDAEETRLTSEALKLNEISEISWMEIGKMSQ